MSFKKNLQLIYPIDLITIAYILITGIFIVFSSAKLQNILPHLLARVVILAIISFLIYLDQNFSKKAIKFLRLFYPLALLSYFYPETDYLNNIFFPNLDPIVANLEVTIFGGQPSVWFAEYCSWKWFNELMNFGYFSYYFLIFIVCFWIYRKSYENCTYGIFIVCMSFYMYYILFIIFPVAGPQFYLTPPDNQLPDAYIFREAIKLVHSLGEGPTAAFPSSHVGILCILLYLAFKFVPKLLKWIIPVGILLFLSTVYIKAHYVIDVIAGVLSFPTMYWLSSRAYQIIVAYLSQLTLRQNVKINSN
jgi:membrane-associated phospholipid phosphatase